MPEPRLQVRKTYKLFIGGQFPRSESGRSYEVVDADGVFLAHAARASRKDARDAVTAARGALAGWSGRTGYNRGQVLYRVAEMLEGRAAQFVDELAAAGSTDPAGEVAAAIDRWVWFAGWADKVDQVFGSANAVSGPYSNDSRVTPTGVIATVTPAEPALLGLVDAVAPLLALGDTAVVVAPASAPLAAITLGEVLATSDLPAGVVNVLTGHVAEIGPWLAAHRDVDGLDLTGVADADLAADLERDAADHLARVLRPGAADGDPLARLRRFHEIRTTWHPLGL